MSWIITGTQKLDPDAAVYIDRVEAADGQSLEEGVKLAYSTFVSGCKTDGIWDAIKASCILAGARTLNGALVPLVGAAPTNNNFVAEDYDRETGLKGDGSTKWLNANRAGNADSLNDYHASVLATQRQSGSFSALIATRSPLAGGSNSTQIIDTGAIFSFVDRGNASLERSSTQTGLAALSRSTSSTVNLIWPEFSEIVSQSPVGQVADDWNIFGRSNGANLANARLAFYSIGESLDLAALDTRVTTLMSDLAAAIP